MRKLMWFSIGFGAACALGAYCYGHWLKLAALLCFLLAALCLTLTKFKKDFRIGCGIFLGIAAGLLWFHMYDSVKLVEARSLDGTTAVVSVDVCDYSYRTDYGCAFDGKVTVDQQTYRVRVYLNRFERLEPGHKVKGAFRFRLTTNGGQEEPIYHQGKGIFLIAYQEGNVVPQRYWQSAVEDLPAIWRKELKRQINLALPKDAEGFARALLLGDRSGIDYETSTAFKVSGISHIVAVSGLHVSILFGFIYMLTIRKRVLTAIIGIPTVLIFAAITGFSPSITRAAIMQILLMLAMALGKEYDPPTSLGFAALCMLIANPLVITSVSFQLSVACMAGIFLFGEKIRSWLMDDKRLGRWKGKFTAWFSGSVSITLSAMVVTSPLVAFYFGTISLIGVLTNLLTLWVITYIFYGIMLICAVGFFSGGAAAFLGGILAWLIRYVLSAAEVFASFPMAAVYTKSIYIVLWLIFAYVLLSVYLYLKNKPALLFAILTATGLCAAVLMSWTEPLLSQCRVTMLDVGQGQSILLQSEGKTFLVGCGGDHSEEAADITAETLLSQGIERLDGIILTHYDGDHAGGVPYLLSRIDTDNLFLPYAEGVDEVGTELAFLSSGTTHIVQEDMKLSYGGADLTIFAPVSYNSGNESSACVLFQTENCDILITGDRGEKTEKMLLSRRELPELEVLVAGHHGSKTSTCEELLETTSPEFVFISAGKDNRYGHPAQEVLDRLLKFGCVIFRTDLYGTIVFRR